MWEIHEVTDHPGAMLTTREVAQKDIAKGKVKQVKGKVKEEIGKETGDKSREIRGKTERVAGKLQVGYGTVKRIIKKAIAK